MRLTSFSSFDRENWVETPLPKRRGAWLPSILTSIELQNQFDSDKQTKWMTFVSRWKIFLIVRFIEKHPGHILTSSGSTCAKKRFHFNEISSLFPSKKKQWKSVWDWKIKKKAQVICQQHWEQYSETCHQKKNAGLSVFIELLSLKVFGPVRTFFFYFLNKAISFL